MPSTNTAGNHAADILDLLEFGAVYSDSELLLRYTNGKILIGHQVRQVYNQWHDATKHKETEVPLGSWMVGRRIATVGQNGMLQLEYTGRLVDVMPSDLAEKVVFGGLKYTFQVSRIGDVVTICNYTDALIRRR